MIHEKVRCSTTQPVIPKSNSTVESGVMDTGNATSYITEIDQKASQYDQLVADIWVGVLLSAILLSCVCCMCTCLIYHKFQRWKRLGNFKVQFSLLFFFNKLIFPVLQDGEAPEILTRDVSINFDCESLPSYTIASGLPSYEEALKHIENFKKLKEKESPQLANSPSRVSLITCIQSIVNEKS